MLWPQVKFQPKDECGIHILYMYGLLCEYKLMFSSKSKNQLFLERQIEYTVFIRLTALGAY